MSCFLRNLQHSIARVKPGLHLVHLLHLPAPTHIFTGLMETQPSSFLLFWPSLARSSPTSPSKALQQSDFVFGRNRETGTEQCGVAKGGGSERCGRTYVLGEDLNCLALSESGGRVSWSGESLSRRVIA
eukprot:1314906-Rhodomonas_salina.1